MYKNNRSDEKYGWIRRIQLQDYLRAVVKIRVLRNESLSFWKFVCMPKRVMIRPPTAEEEERENSRSRSRSVSADLMAGLKGAAAAASSSSSIKTPIDGSKTSGLKGILHKAPSAEERVERVVQPAVEPESKQEIYDPDADLNSFNESLALAAKEAIMRGLYGSRNSKADVDNISSLTSKGEKAEPDAESHVPKANALKLNKVYDDNGEEVTGNLETAHCQDLAFIASSNARLNTRLTSKEEFALPQSSKAAIEQLHQVNKAWSASEMAAALDAINSEEFDTNLHFSGPRSGPPSLSQSPNVSVTSFSGADLNRTDLSIMPGPPPHGVAGSTALSSSLKSSQFKMSASPSASPKVSHKVSLSSAADSTFMTPKPPAEELQGGAAGSILPPNAPEKRPRPAVATSSISATIN